MVDERDTGEHFIGYLGDEEELNVQISARRVADLATQIDFLDREIARYRELIERERIRHATEVAELQLKADTELDEHRRDERLEIQALHDSYRSLLNERQIEFEQTLSEAAATNAAALAAERKRYEDMLASERSRRDVLLEANRRNAVEELSQSHQRSRQSLVSELAQAATTIERLQHDLAQERKRAASAEQQAQSVDGESASFKHRLDTLEQNSQIRINELETRLETANQRIAAERKRSAATLSELLERSASIAAEADRARSEYAAERAKAAHTLATEQQRSYDEYQALADAADDRAGQALVREAQLEAMIAELRARLTASDVDPKYCDEGDDASSIS